MQEQGRGQGRPLHTLALTTSVPASWMRSVSAFIFSAGRSTRGVACTAAHAGSVTSRALWQTPCLACQTSGTQADTAGRAGTPLLERLVEELSG